MKKNKMKRIAALIFSLILFVASIPLFASANEADLTDEEKSVIEGLRQQQAELDEKIEEAYASIEALKDDIENEQEYAEQLTQQLNNLDQQITVLNQSIAAYDDDIEYLDEQIRANKVIIDNLQTDMYAYRQKSIDLKQLKEDTLVQLQDRLRYLYMTGEATELEALLDSDNLYSFLMRLELMNGIAEYDNALFKKLYDSIEGAQEAEVLYQKKADAQAEVIVRLEEDTAEIEMQKTEAQTAREKLEVTQEEHHELYVAAMDNISALDKESEEYELLVATYDADRASFDAEIERLIEEYNSQHAEEASIAASISESASIEAESRYQASLEASSALAQVTTTTQQYIPPTTTAPTQSGNVSSSGMIHPLSQYSDIYISSPYGNRIEPATGSTGFHTGTDFCSYSGTMGKNVVAAANGTVVTATWHSSYGYYVLISHGNNLYTLYAHNSELLVSEGDYVTQGQVISHAGSTGYSTGAHVHFEVRVNGSTTNPMSYVTL